MRIFITPMRATYSAHLILISNFMEQSPY